MKTVTFWDTSRKGSLQLSVNAIVILILAITLLSLGLSFIRNLFGGAVAKLAGIQSQLDEEQRKQLEESQEEITFLTSRIEVKGREQGVNIAIRNVRSTQLTFQIQGDLEAIADLEPRERRKQGAGFYCFDAIGKEAREKIQEDPALITFQTFEERTIDPQRADVLPIQISVNPAAPPTVYSCELRLFILREQRKDSDEDPSIDVELDAEPCQRGETDGCKQLYATKLFEIDYKKQ